MDDIRRQRFADFVAKAARHITAWVKAEAEIFLGSLFEAFGQKGLPQPSRPRAAMWSPVAGVVMLLAAIMIMITEVLGAPALCYGAQTQPTTRPAPAANAPPAADRLAAEVRIISVEQDSVGDFGDCVGQKLDLEKPDAAAPPRILRLSDRQTNLLYRMVQATTRMPTLTLPRLTMDAIKGQEGEIRTGQSRLVTAGTTYQMRLKLGLKELAYTGVELRPAHFKVSLSVSLEAVLSEAGGSTIVANPVARLNVNLDADDRATVMMEWPMDATLLFGPPREEAKKANAAPRRVFLILMMKLLAPDPDYDLLLKQLQDHAKDNAGRSAPPPAPPATTHPANATSNAAPAGTTYDLTFDVQIVTATPAFMGGLGLVSQPERPDAPATRSLPIIAMSDAQAKLMAARAADENALAHASRLTFPANKGTSGTVTARIQGVGVAGLPQQLQIRERFLGMPPPAVAGGPQHVVVSLDLEVTPMPAAKLSVVLDATDGCTTLIEWPQEAQRGADQAAAKHVYVMFKPILREIEPTANPPMKPPATQPAKAGGSQG